MQKNTVYQLSTAQSLISGLAEGKYTSNEITKFGIGAMNHYSGEMIVSNNKVFVANYYGEINEVADTQKSPFAIITLFNSDIEFAVKSSNQNKAFELITKELNTSELIYAIKIIGKFNFVSLRSGKEQQKPYPDFNIDTVKIHLSEKPNLNIILPKPES